MELLEVDQDMFQQQTQDWQESYAAEREQHREATQSKEWWATGAAAAPSSGPERAGRGGAAGPGNTATDTSNPTECWHVTGGVDLLEVSIFGWFRDFNQLSKALEAGRCAAMTKTASRRVDVAAASLYMREKGHRWGNTFMSWVGEYDGITISIGRPSKSKRVAIAKVQIGSLKLMRDGHRAAWAHALRILEGLGIVVERATVARIDVCADLAHVDCAKYVEAVLERRYVTRLKSQSAFYRDRLASIIDYLVTDYFRLTTHEPDRENNNQNLAPASPEWQAVVEAFQWATEEVEELTPLEAKPVDRKRFDERLKHAALALAKSLGPGVVWDARTFIQGVVDSLVRTMPPSWEIKVLVRRAWEETLAAGLDGVADFSAPDQLSPGWVVTLAPEREELDDW
jgi:hypothetical protein